MHSHERNSGRYCLKEIGWQGKIEASARLALFLSVVRRITVIGRGLARIGNGFAARSEDAGYDWDCLSRGLAQHQRTP